MTIRGFSDDGAASVAGGPGAGAGDTVSAPPETPAIVLDESQRRVIALPIGRSASVVGAPGSGKTTTLVELVADRVLSHGYSTDAVVALAATRSSATRMRDRLALRIDRPSRGPLARTVNSLAFEAVTASATRLAPLGRETGRGPTLLTGGEQDAIIAEMLDGHLAEGRGPEWPHELGADVRRLRAFRTELREFMMRATEHGLDPRAIAELGRETGRPEWMAAAEFAVEYQEVVDAMSEVTGTRLDSAEIASFAIEAIRSGDAGERIDALRLIVVDDLQEAGESTIGVLRAFAERGVTIVAFGDPDVASSVFRGGEADSIGRFAERVGIADAEALVLDRVHRHGSTIRSVVTTATGRIGAAASGRQRAAPAAHVPEGRAVDGVAPPVTVLMASTPAREVSGVARLLREAHLRDSVAWRDMVVIVRSGAAVGPLARALAVAEVPTRTSVAGRPLRDDPAARALLSLVDVAIDPARLDAAVAVDLLTGVFGGIDKIGLRRLRLALRAEELAGDGNRPSDELLVEALAGPGRFATIDSAAARRAERLATSLSTLRELHSAGASIEELLWSAWEASRLATTWYEAALGTGLAAAEANRNLDGIVALFSSARRFVERSTRHSAALFVQEVLHAEVPEDTLAPRADDDTVLVATPSAVVGAQYEIAVVARLQDGIWPNMRIRGSLLDPSALVDAAQGRAGDTIDRRALTLSDELRMFTLAASRARSRLVLSAVSGEDESPSMFFRLVPPDTPRVDADGRPGLTLRGAVGDLRRRLTSGARGSENAAAALAHLAGEQVAGAAPTEWLGLLEPSTTAPLHDLDDPESPDGPVPVSPSKLEAFEQSPVNWFVDSVSGSSTSTAMGVGTLVHWVLENHTDPDADALWAALESRWKELVFEAPWLGERQKRATRVLIDGLSDYLRDFERSGAVRVSAEDRFTLDLDPAVVRGSIDRVERSADGAITIVDLKTGRSHPPASAVAEHAQLGTYQLALAHGVIATGGASATADGETRIPPSQTEHADASRARSGGAKLLFVAGGVRGKRYREIVQEPYTDEQLDALRERIRLAAIGMAAAEFEGLLDAAPFSPGEALRYVIHTIPEVTER